MGDVIFSDRKNGYDKTQVDEYIKKIAVAYQELYEEHVATKEKYDSLLEDYKKLEEQNQGANDSELISKTLIETEKLAEDIIANARREEAKIMDLTAKNLENAYFALERAMDEVGLEAQKFFGGGDETKKDNFEISKNQDRKE